jgi:hypothetical protein|tara:strand:- start:183 stop:419 length:237 start_codon:yes stop_codon:yes gene_type:complete
VDNEQRSSVSSETDKKRNGLNPYEISLDELKRVAEDNGGKVTLFDLFLTSSEYNEVVKQSLKNGILKFLKYVEKKYDK